jgi:ABC-type branched-subunit amino acid transport system substrate-binding protein
MKFLPKLAFSLFGAAIFIGAAAAQTTAPVRIGSTLALTGPLSATAMTHKLVGEIYVEQLNSRGGLMGRKVEWVLKDDQSKPDLARTTSSWSHPIRSIC